MEGIWDLLTLYFFSLKKKVSSTDHCSTRADLFQEILLNTDRHQPSPTTLKLQCWGERDLAALAPLFFLPASVTLSILVALPCAAILYFSFATVPLCQDCHLNAAACACDWRKSWGRYLRKGLWHHELNSYCHVQPCCAKLTKHL